MAIKKMALLRLTPDAIVDLFQLPKGVEIVRIEMAPGVRGEVNVMIEGAGWDTAEGGAVVPASPGICMVKRDEAGRIYSKTVDWRLPE